MSQENVEAYMRAVEAFNRPDIEALLEELDREVEWYSALSGMGSEVYRGVEGVHEIGSGHRRGVRELDLRGL